MEPEQHLGDHVQGRGEVVSTPHVGELVLDDRPDLRRGQ
jgi:hypothetical protein